MKRSRSSAEHYQWGQACDGWRLADQPGLSVIEERMPPGTSEVRHFHQHARQFFFVLAGEATLELDGVGHALGPREGMEVAPGVPHTLQNRGAADLEFLVISAPTTRGDRVDASAARSPHGAGEA